MNEDQDLKPTGLDDLIGDHHLQMMKAALPYMNAAGQKTVSLFVKFRELHRTIDLFQNEENAAMGICSVGEQPSSPLDMLNTIKPFGNPYEQEFIDLIVNFMQGFKMSRAYQETSPDLSGQEARSVGNAAPPFGQIPLEQLKNFLPPEQQSRLENIQLLMSVMQQMT